MATDCDGYKQSLCGLDVHIFEINKSAADSDERDRDSEPASSLIFLPGRGSVSSKYADRYLSRKFILPPSIRGGGIRLIFVSSPILDEHENLPTWFRYSQFPAKDIDTADRYLLCDVESAATKVQGLVMHEVRRCGWANTFLGGHSQGAMLALYVQITRLEQPLAGLALFSGFLLYPLRQLIALVERKGKVWVSCDLAAFRDRGRVFAWHGDQDELFPAKKSLAAYNELLTALGAEAALKMSIEAPGIAHSPVPPEAYLEVFSAMLGSAQ